MIKIKNVSFIYPKSARPALDGLNALIPTGIHLLVGPNGAGKTTLLHAFAGLTAPQEGEILIDGANAASTLPSVKSRIFMLDENLKLTDTTIRKFSATHSAFYPDFSGDLLDYNLEAFGLTGNEPLRKLSTGDRKKTLLSFALALGVDLLLLDEPTNGLDIESKDTLRRLIVSQADITRTIIISTHNVSEFRNLYDGLIAINKGKLLLSATAEEISEVLEFSISPRRNPDALFSELCIGGYSAICPNSGDESSDIDWELLYKALMSDKGQQITSLFFNKDQYENE